MLLTRLKDDDDDDDDDDGIFLSYADDFLYLEFKDFKFFKK